MGVFADAKDWVKEKAKAHPYLTGAIALGGTTALIVGTGPVGLIVVATAAATGGSIGKGIASDPGEKKEEKK